MKKIGAVLCCLCMIIGIAFPVLADSNEAYEIRNGNAPYFTREELTGVSTKSFSSLDALGRCQKAFAVIGPDLMPTKKRESIGMIRPTGWHLVKYKGIDGKYLYNRCHLIGYQLCGENANPLNLITGTRFLNVKGMLPFENMVADYVKETGNHVAYRATPDFQQDNAVASGVQIEAQSIEDDGAGIEFNVYCYNIQPGIQIDYATGDSSQLDAASNEIVPITPDVSANYIININTGVFHRPDCYSVSRMAEYNKEYYTGTRDTIIQRGYRPCQNFNP